MGEYQHSKQAQFDRSKVSCGVLEVHHLPDIPSSQTVFAIANHLYHKANGRPGSFLIFSDVVGGATPSRGELLAAELTKTTAAGPLTTTDKAVNPRTGNQIRLWILTINHDSFRKWYTEEYVNRVNSEQ